MASKCHAMAAELHRRLGDVQRADHHLVAAAKAAQLSGDMWAVPQRLHLLAELRRDRGQYEAANDAFERAEAIIDSLVGKSSTAIEKMALIRSASDIYTSHVSLLADHFKDAARAYAVVEQVRGRIAVDQLLAGTVRSGDARRIERAIAALRLKLMQADSTRDVKRLRDEMFMLEQTRWAAPGISILKRRSSMTVDVAEVQKHLPAGTALLEYVVAAPSSYCLVLTGSSLKIVPIASRDELEKLAAAFLAKVKARQPSVHEGRRLYNVLLAPTGTQRVSRLVVVRDGPLHLLPFEALSRSNGRYLAETSTVSYATSATSFHLLSREAHRQPSRSMLGVGGVGYTHSRMNTAGIARSNQRFRFTELPSSGEEIRAAASALGSSKTTILSGSRATESAFKRAELGSFQFIHMAVHGSHGRKNPDRAALVMLSDPQNGEDGFLYAPEIVQLGLSAELVVLSACETAVGPLQGQEASLTYPERSCLQAAAPSYRRYGERMTPLRRF